MEQAVSGLLEKCESVLVEQKHAVSEDNMQDLSGIKENRIKNYNVIWPFVAGGAGLFTLFIVLLTVFRKKDDKEGKDKKETTV